MRSHSSLYEVNSHRQFLVWTLSVFILQLTRERWLGRWQWGLQLEINPGRVFWNRVPGSIPGGRSGIGSGIQPGGYLDTGYPGAHLGNQGPGQRLPPFQRFSGLSVPQTS